MALLMPMLLLLMAVLRLLMWGPRIATTLWILWYTWILLLILSMLLPVLLLLRVVLFVGGVVGNQVLRHLWRTSLQIDVYPSSVVFCGILQPLFTAHLLDPGLYLLYMVVRIVSFANDSVQTVTLYIPGRNRCDCLHMQMCFTMGSGISYSLLENILGLLEELTVQIDGVAFDPPGGIILAEDEVRGLLIVLVHHCAMSFALFGEPVSGGSVPSFIGVAGLAA